MFKDVVQAAQNMKMEEDKQITFQYLLRQFFFTLICHIVGSMPIWSPILSFCAMLSQTVHMAKVAKGDKIEAKGAWKEPGNFNSHLSALTWTAQVLLLNYACFQEQGDEDQILVFLCKICQSFFQQLAETPFGHILQWQLYLFQTSKHLLARHQAW